MTFTSDVVRRSWIRQGGMCAHCGQGLAWDNRDGIGMGAWHPHHRKPESRGGSNDIDNCAIFCCDNRNCHLKIGHGGSMERHAEISDVKLPYLHAGQA